MKPRHLLIVVALLLVSGPARAQDVFPVGVTPPVFIVPASGVAGNGVVTAPQLLLPNGSAAAPAAASAANPSSGLYFIAAVPALANTGVAILGVFSGGLQVPSTATIGWGTGAVNTVNQTVLSTSGAGKLTLTGTTPMFQLGGTTSSFPAIKASGNSLNLVTADDAGWASINLGGITNKGVLVYSGTAPTISSGFGTTPSIVANNGTAAFTLNVGTGGAAASGVVGLPAATTGWNCFATDRNTNVVTRETATTTTTATLTAASAWAASDILQVSCFAY